MLHRAKAEMLDAPLIKLCYILLIHSTYNLHSGQSNPFQATFSWETAQDCDESKSG